MKEQLERRQLDGGPDDRSLSGNRLDYNNYMPPPRYPQASYGNQGDGQGYQPGPGNYAFSP